jgi:glycosyltransferase involved in cell wall biosynthesis
MRPLISILLPTRNGAAYLRDCVTGVLAQPDNEFELIVADNASDDDTPQILHEFADDSRLRVVRSERSLPVTSCYPGTFRKSSTCSTSTRGSTA